MGVLLLFGYVIQAETYQFDCCELLVIRLGPAMDKKSNYPGCYSKKNLGFLKPQGLQNTDQSSEWLRPPGENLQWGFRDRCSRGNRAAESDALRT